MKTPVASGEGVFSRILGPASVRGFHPGSRIALILQYGGLKAMLKSIGGACVPIVFILAGVNGEDRSSKEIRYGRKLSIRIESLKVNNSGIREIRAHALQSYTK